MDIPKESSRVEEAQKRTPLWNSQWKSRLELILEHPASPPWNANCGDRLTQATLEAARAFARRLWAAPPGLSTPFWDWPQACPGPEAFTWLKQLYPQSLDLQERVGRLNPWRKAEDWFEIPTQCREDLQKRLALIVPEGADYEGLVVNPTSGTTRQPILCPNHIEGVACYEPLVLYAVAQHGVRLNLDFNQTAAVQICCQRNTLVYGTVHAYSGGAGFAKVNIDPNAWPPSQAREYLKAVKPQLLTGDPYAFSVYRELDLGWKPKAVVSTAMELDDPLRRQLEEYFECPVINYYSLNETGPMAYSLPASEGLRIFPPDVGVECLDAQGYPVSSGELGEITFTGGRNPYLPLVRYRTGDFGRLDSTGVIRDLQGRKPVVFRDFKGSRINPVDVARIIRFYPVLAYQLIQATGGALTLHLQAPALTTPQKMRISIEIKTLFGGWPLSVGENFDPKVGKYLPHVGLMG